MGAVQETYIIMGAAIFEALTALHLSQERPLARIILVDRTPFPNPSAAGAWSESKITRADYPDLLYMKLALEAQEQWRRDPIYAPIYHESEVCFSLKTLGMGRAALKNYESLGRWVWSNYARPRESHERALKGIYANGGVDWSQTKLRLNLAVVGPKPRQHFRNVIQNAVNNDVEYIADAITKLILNQSHACTGVETASGRRRLSADYI